MTDFKKRQAERLKQVLTEQGIYQKDFAKKFGFSTVTVSQWKTGKVAMREESAAEINKIWPEYPIDWLRGISDSRTPQEDFFYKITACREEGAKLLGGFALLADLSGFRVEWPYSDALESGDIEQITDSIKHRFAVISKDGSSVPLSMDDLYELANQISDYVEMRLSRLVSRGEW